MSGLVVTRTLSDERSVLRTLQFFKYLFRQMHLGRDGELMARGWECGLQNNKRSTYNL